MLVPYWDSCRFGIFDAVRSSYRIPDCPIPWGGSNPSYSPSKACGIKCCPIVPTARGK